MTRRVLVGMAWSRGTRNGNAGEVRQGSEAKGNAGRVEVRQARSDAATNEMLRKDKAGGERCDQERRDGWS